MSPTNSLERIPYCGRGEIQLPPTGRRRGAAADRAKLAAILQALGQIGIERPEARSIDLNPLILEGSDPIVVDALVELESQPGDGA